LYTWNSDWIKKYESPWCIVNKFMLANSVNGPLAATAITNSIARDVNRCWYVSTHTGIISNYSFNNTSFEFKDCTIIQYGESNMIYLLKALLKQQKRLYTAEDICKPIFDRNLKICPCCLKQTQHSLYHQFTFLDKCLIHNTKLINRCPECNNLLNYEINFKKDIKAFQCSHCGKSLINQEFSEVVEEWYESDGIDNIIHDEPFSLYKHLMPYVITVDTNNSINDKIINKTLGEMFKNETITSLPKYYSKNNNNWNEITFSGIITSQLKDKKQIQEYTYIIAFNIIYKHFRNFNHLGRKVNKIKHYIKICNQHRITNSNTVKTILTNYFDEKSLIFYLWKRDMECSTWYYKDYYIDACNYHPYHFNPNEDIIRILEKTANILSNDVPETIQYNILIHIAISLMIQKYNQWVILINDLIKRYNEYDLLDIINNITLKSSINIEFLLLIDENNFDYKIYFDNV